MSHRIMIVEDDPGLGRTLEAHLNWRGSDALLVTSAESALAKIHDFSPDMVLTDVRLGEMSGLELLERLSQMHYPANVVVMTAHETMKDAIRAVHAGAFEYLSKPFIPSELDEVLDRSAKDRAQHPKRPSAQSAAKELFVPGAIVGRSKGMIKIWKEIGQLGSVKTAVLIRGETGTGKELVARAIHDNSDWSNEPFVAVNCTAVAETLLESELFGHVRGAFTGAVADRKGRFELAGDGTIFLDEIGDTSLAFQAKLLRVIQEREFYPVGSERGKRTGARVVAATHRPIEELVRSGKFREDLYFRLRVVEISIPPLRERAGDIPELVRHLLEKLARQLRREHPYVSPETMAALGAHDWPGNVRELENTLTRAMVLARGNTIRTEDLGLVTAPTERARGPVPDARTLGGVEWRHVEQVLAACDQNKSRAARALGISRPRLDRILAKRRNSATNSGQPYQLSKN